ncbi:hypothetical protein B0T24DRAFT_646238 [Lasiosphaeria ovina]|uniref:VHS domain-containing protein n=1 Tax=Lasiosphaeria ovina TaxID=92902 RepID=A0AAE0NMH9_9PEZI|nr:hypothetical protein B0T24DRAFT_646238 [Lasiosphaeria ovina]
MFSSKKPYTAVTVTVERLTSEAIPENDLSGIPDLVEVVNLQDSGPVEAARAIRKKLKYGNLHRQLRALTLLDGLIQNAGPRFQRTFADEPLLERLRFCATADLSDPDVKKKCAVLFRSWAAEYKSTRGMERVASLYKELPRRKHAVTQERSKVLKETANPFGDDEDEEERNPAGPSQPSPAQPSPASRRMASVSGAPFFGPQVTGQVESFSHVGKDKKKKEKDKKNKKHKPFNLEAEKEQMKAHIAEASIAATNLTNTLQTINREKERISENQLALERFETCKQLRRKILRYIHHVDSEQWLGGLLHANDELVTALMTFEQLDRSIDADSDSDDDVAEQAHLYRSMNSLFLPFILLRSRSADRLIVATEKAKGKEPNSPTSPRSPIPGMVGLSLSTSPPPHPPRPVPPPRPSAMTKPSMSSPRQVRQQVESEDEDDFDEEDENDPFADRNALATPKVDREEPKW